MPINHKCDVCDKLATVQIIDMDEAEPVKAPNGQLYASFRPHGKPHHYCDSHKRPNIIFRMDGSIYLQYADGTNRLEEIKPMDIKKD